MLDTNERTQAITQALDFGTGEASAVRYLLTAASLAVPPLVAVDVVEEIGSPQAAAHFLRPLPSMTAYDLLLERCDPVPEAAR